MIGVRVDQMWSPKQHSNQYMKKVASVGRVLYKPAKYHDETNILGDPNQYRRVRQQQNLEVAVPVQSYNDFEDPFALHGVLQHKAAGCSSSSNTEFRKNVKETAEPSCNQTVSIIDACHRMRTEQHLGPVLPFGAGKRCVHHQTHQLTCSCWQEECISPRVCLV